LWSTQLFDQPPKEGIKERTMSEKKLEIKKENNNETQTQTKTQNKSQSNKTKNQTTQTTQNNQTTTQNNNFTTQNISHNTTNNQTTQTTQNNQTTTTQTNPPKEEPTLGDFEVFEKNLKEQQGNLTKQTKMVNSLLDEYNTLKVSLTSRIEGLKSERKKYENQKLKLQEDYSQICVALKELEERIQNQEKDLVNQLSLIKKKAEQTKITYPPI